MNIKICKTLSLYGLWMLVNAVTKFQLDICPFEWAGALNVN